MTRPTIAQQLDDVLAPCPGCGGESTRVIGGPGTAGGPKFWVGCDFCRWRTWGDTEADAISQWNKRTIRAAVGGEALVFGHYFRDASGNQHFHTGATVPPFAQSDITPLYASPPATVDVGALQELCDEMLAKADSGDPSYTSEITREVVSRFAALIAAGDALAEPIGEKA